MKRRTSWVALSFVLCSTLAASAQAHVRLTYPTPRYPAPDGALDNGAELKDQPCGVPGDSRTADQTRISVFQPGETIMVEFKESIDHDGFYRISFDDDGQDAFEFPTTLAEAQQPAVLPVLVDNITDKSGFGNTYTQEITFPNIECENCTLQLIQVMRDEGETTFTEDHMYFQCADIALRAGGAGGSGGGGAGGAGGTGGIAGSGGSGGIAGSAGSGGSGGGAGSSAGGTGGSAPAAGGGGGVLGAGGSGGAATGGSGGSTAATQEEPAPGCGCRTTRTPGETSLLTLLLGAGLITMRHRRARRVHRAPA